MATVATQPTDGQSSILQRSTESKTRDSRSKNIMYNGSYAIENFVNVVSDVGNQAEVFKVLTDPTYSGFKLFFHFDSPTGLLSDEENVNSALAYLKRIGRIERYELLKKFIEILSKVNSITPWMFQDIEGLQELYTEPFEDIYKINKINIACLETIDNKIGSLMQMYRNIAFDHHSRKWILPVNLRRFSMSIFVYDYRMFSDLDATSVDFLQTIENTDVSQLNHTLFDLGYCTFTNEAGGSFFETVSNNRSEANVNNISINFEQYDISGLFKSIAGTGSIGSAAIAATVSANVNGVTTDAGFFSTENLLKRVGAEQVREKVTDLLDTDMWKTKLQAFGTNVASEQLEKIRGALGKLFFRNVYGFNVGGINNLAQGPISRTINQFSEIPSLRNNESQERGGDLGNVNN